LFSAQLGYLNSIPEGWGKTSRLELALERKEDLQLPKLGREVYLVEALKALGYTSHVFEGERPLSWKDVYYYKETFDPLLNKWEVETLLEMSADYLNAKIEGVNPLCIPPVDRDNVEPTSANQ